MFAEGASDPDRVDTFMYSAESEDFAEGKSRIQVAVFVPMPVIAADSDSLNFY